jgi:signal transduction histidine kinase
MATRSPRTGRAPVGGGAPSAAGAVAPTARTARTARAAIGRGSAVGGSEVDLERKVQRLSGLLRVSSLVAANLDLDAVLQTVVNAAREFSDATLSGLLVVSETNPREYDGFWVSGWETPPHHYPTGAGVFNLPVRTGLPVRVDNVPDHPASVGTPDGHPPIGPFLGAPLKTGSHIVGTLFVGNLTGGKPFTADDEELLVAFAAHAAVAIQNARLYRQVEELAILRERERIAVDLHDTVAQLFFSIGMEAEALRETHAPGGADYARLTRVRSLAASGTRKVREAIGALYDRGGTPEDANIYRRLSALCMQFRSEYGMHIGLMATGSIERLGPDVRDVLYRGAREALTNVVKHAHTDKAVISVVVGDSDVTLTVEDDGQGLRPGALERAPHVDHFGLTALRRQLERLGGRLEVQGGDDGGAVVRCWCPLTA